MQVSGPGFSHGTVSQTTSPTAPRIPRHGARHWPTFPAQTATSLPTLPTKVSLLISIYAVSSAPSPSFTRSNTTARAPARISWRTTRLTLPKRIGSLRVSRFIRRNDCRSLICRICRSLLFSMGLRVIILGLGNLGKVS